MASIAQRFSRRSHFGFSPSVFTSARSGATDWLLQYQTVHTAALGALRLCSAVTRLWSHNLARTTAPTLSKSVLASIRACMRTSSTVRCYSPTESDLWLAEHCSRHAEQRPLTQVLWRRVYLQSQQYRRNVSRSLRDERIRCNERSASHTGPSISHRTVSRGP